MTLQLVAERSANDRVALSAIIPPPSAPALLSRVSTARHGSIAMKLALDEIAALEPMRKGVAEGTAQFFSGTSMSSARSTRAAKAAVTTNSRTRTAQRIL